MSAATTDTRMARPEAIEIAKAFVAELEGAYDQLIVGGSLRRRLAYVHDIEIIAVPKVEHQSTGLFEGMATAIDRLNARLTALLDNNDVAKRRKSDGSWAGWGPRNKFLTYQGARVDLFCAVNDWDKAPAMAEPGRFGWLLLLRTGPAAFSRQLVVPKVDDKGRPGRTKDRRPGLMPAHLVAEGGWLRYRTSREPIETPTEQSVFELFGLPYQEPWERT